MKLLLFTSLINLITASNPHEMYTVCLDNSSLLVVGASPPGPEILPELLAPSTGNYTPPALEPKVPRSEALLEPKLYISFKENCYPGSESKKHNKIKVRVYPSFPLLKQVGGRKKLITHVNLLFSESNKIFVNQLNVRLVPEIIIPKSTDSVPINGGINVVGDLNTFGTYIRGKPRVPINIFITNNYQGIVGAAYLSTLGSTNFNYAVSINKDSVISHEILHVFGAQHTFGKGGVLDYSNRLINNVLQMHPDNKPQVCSILDYYYKNKV
jgi:hypothetical protein